MKVWWQGFDLSSKAKKEIEKGLADLIKSQAVKGKVEISLSIVGDQRMKNLNSRYMGRIGTTDVLSFPLDKELGPDKIVRLGDVVVCLSEVKRQAKKEALKEIEVLQRLFKHGLKHLLGIHH